MNALDSVFLLLLGFSLTSAVASFALIEKYLLAHGLADPKASRPDVIDFYKKYISHTKKSGGRVGRPFLVHVASAAAFMLGGAVYVILRMGPWVLSALT